MPMVTVSISPQQAAGIRAAVDNGGYASSSEVVREALRLWD
ncbi:type II toxin-antitoxin system ParD family antitoxin, partial [Rhizobium johnstonii]